MVEIGSFAFAYGSGLWAAAKANVPISKQINFKIFARGQSPDRKQKIVMSRYVV
jgi:hypothetical protein